jgi:hypothetical protein
MFYFVLYVKIHTAKMTSIVTEMESKKRKADDQIIRDLQEWRSYSEHYIDSHERVENNKDGKHEDMWKKIFEDYEDKLPEKRKRIDGRWSYYVEERNSFDTVANLAKGKIGTLALITYTNCSLGAEISGIFGVNNPVSTRNDSIFDEHKDECLFIRANYDLWEGLIRFEFKIPKDSGPKWQWEYRHSVQISYGGKPLTEDDMHTYPQYSYIFNTNKDEYDYADVHIISGGFDDEFDTKIVNVQGLVVTMKKSARSPNAPDNKTE